MLKNTLNIQKEIFELLKPFDWTTMIELGNKTSEAGHKGKSYKEMFEKQGIKHISIDLNGRNGALGLDLSKPIKLASADILTNFGTSEHVLENQEQVFRNIHNLSHYRIVHVLPKVGNWARHGYWHFNLKFFELLAELNDYKINKLFILNKYPKELVCCSYTKVNSNEFKWNSSLPIHSNKTAKGTVIAYEEH